MRALALLVAMTIWSVAVSAAETVAVRGGVEPNQGRLVFEWRHPVDYTARIEGTRLLVSFDREASFELGNAARHLYRYLKNAPASTEGQNVSLELARSYELRHFRLGDKVVIDLIGPPGDGSPPLPANDRAATAGAETKPAAAPAEGSAATAESEPTATARVELPRVGVRRGEHPGFSRLVVDWSDNVHHTLSRDGNRATLSFERPADLDLARVRADLPPYVAGVEARSRDGGVDLVVTVAEGAALRVGEDGPKVYLDVLKPDAAATAQAETAAPVTAESTSEATAAKTEPTESAPTSLVPETETAEAPAAPAPPVHPAQDAVVPEPAAPAVDKAARAGEPEAAAVQPRTEQPAQATAGQLHGADYQEMAAAQTMPPVPAPAEPLPPAAHPAGDAAMAPSMAAHPTQPHSSVFDLAAITPPPPQPPINALSVTVERAAESEAEAPVPGRQAAPLPAQRLRFEWPVPVAAAAFRHQGKLWLLFDREVTEDFAKKLAKDAPELAPIEPLAVAGATVLRFAASPGLTPRFAREGNSWIVDLRVQAPLPEVELLAEVEERGGAPVVSVALSQPGHLFRVPSAESGLDLIVVPLGAAGAAFPSARAFPQLRLLATLQGAAVQPLADGVVARVIADDLLVGLPDGMVATAPAELQTAAAEAAAHAEQPRLLDLKTWRRGGAEKFLPMKQKLQQAVAGASPEKLPFARLELARFFFAHGLAAEALGAVQVAVADDPRLADDPEVRLIKGASEVQLEDYAAAAKSLDHPALYGDPDAALWRAALAAAGQSWSAAADGFEGTETLIEDYAPSVRNDLRLALAEARLAVADSGTASQLLDALRAEAPNQTVAAKIAFLDGKRLLLDGDVEGAKKVWRDLAYGRHGPASARARLALVEQGLSDGSMTPQGAVEELERLRFAWRGDSFEFALLRRLADLYLDIDEPRQALRSLREAASNFPKAAGAETIAARMGEVFKSLYLSPEENDLPALRALAIYEEFKELTPVGPEGDRVIANLADRLVAVDLLGRAGKLLENQIGHRLKGAEKAKVGARLAVIRLLDRDPAAALEALKTSEAKDLDVALQRERRRLEAQALALLGREKAALALVADDSSEEGLRLKAEILRRAGRWKEVAAVLFGVVPSSPPVDRGLTAVESQSLTDLAVALTLGGDRAALKKLDERFGAAMAETPQAPTFKLLAGDLGAGGGLSIAQELVKVGQAEAFLSNYRQRLQQASLSSLN